VVGAQSGLLLLHHLIKERQGPVEGGKPVSKRLYRLPVFSEQRGKWQSPRPLSGRSSPGGSGSKRSYDWSPTIDKKTSPLVAIIEKRSFNGKIAGEFNEKFPKLIGLELEPSFLHRPG